MPPEREAFLFSHFLIFLFIHLFILIEECRLVVFDLLEYSPHEGFADEAALIGDTVFLAETIQRFYLALVEQDGDLIFAWLLFQ